MKFLYITVRNFVIKFKDETDLFLEKAIRAIIYVSVFLIPLFFIPISSEFVEFSKVILFYVLMILAIVFWLLKIYISKRINWQLHFLDIPLILFLFVYLLASFFSVDKYHSFLGANLVIANSFITIFFLVLFYFFVSRFFNKIKQIKIILYILVFVVFFILLINIFQLFFANSWLLFFDLSINTFNFLLVLAFILTGFLFLSNEDKKFKVLNLIFAIIFLSTLFILDKEHVLLLLILAIFIFILLLSFKSAYFSNRLVITLTLLLFLTVIILIIPLSSYIGLISPSEFNLSPSIAWQVTKSSLSENLIFGMGPQNFSYSFYKYKPIVFNQTIFWQLGFEKNYNFWLELLNNAGLIVGLILIIIFVKYYKKLLVFIKKFKIFDKFSHKKFLFVCCLGVIMSSFIIWAFFDNFDFVLFYLFILFLALNVSFLKQKSTNFFLNKNLINLFIYLFIIIILTFVYFGAKIVLAEAYNEKVSVKKYSSVEDFEQAQNYIKKAILYNSKRVDYNLKLADLLINKKLFLDNNKKGYDQNSLSERIFENLNIVLEKESKRIDNYLGLQQTIKKLKKIGFEVNNLKKAINQRLLALDPNNPELYIDRALLNFDDYLLIKKDKVDVPNKEKAIEALAFKIKADIEKSLNLKDDFVLGYYNLGLYYQEFGQEKKALENIRKAFDLDPSQKLIAMSLKKLYLNQDKVDEAIYVLNKYLEYNPEDKDVIQILEELK